MIDNIKMILATQEALREADLWVNTATATAIAKALMENGVSVVKDINVPSDVPDTNVGKWIPVSERLPTEEDADRHGDVLARYWDGTSSVVDWEMATTHTNLIGYWMPLPEPPKEEE